jgi:hypothetical protein
VLKSGDADTKNSSCWQRLKEEFNPKIVNEWICQAMVSPTELSLVEIFSLNSRLEFRIIKQGI